jgi:hypothetical protein
MTKFKLALLLGTLLLAEPFLALAGDDGVPMDCDPATNCGAVPVTPPGGEDMPGAGEAQPQGTAPGQPIEAPDAPNPDPVAPNEPPAPDTSYGQ